MKNRQVVETERFSLQEFARYCRLAYVGETGAHTRRDITDALATVAWARALRRASGGDSPYAIGMKIEPEAYWVVEEVERLHRNKWPKYARGLHRPSAKMIEQAERVYPGSLIFQSSALWSTLRRPPMNMADVRRLEAALCPEVRLLLSRWQQRQLSQRKPSLEWLASTLEKLGSLDALAAVILQMQAAHVSGQVEVAQRWAQRVYRCLMILSLDLMGNGIARPLFELVELRFLSHLRGSWRYFYPSGSFPAAAGHISHALWHIKGVPYSSMSPKQQFRYIQRLVGGDYGWDLGYGLNPFKVPTTADAVTSDSDSREFQRAIWTFTWAWNMLKSGRQHRFPPPAQVFDGTDLFARRETV